MIKQNMADDFHRLHIILSKCRNMMDLEHHQLIHILREKNYVVDQLASWSYDMDLGVGIFHDPPIWIGMMLMNDCLGISKARYVYSDVVF